MQTVLITVNSNSLKRMSLNSQVIFGVFVVVDGDHLTLMMKVYEKHWYYLGSRATGESRRSSGASGTLGQNIRKKDKSK